MGRQVNFYMADEDTKEFLEFIRSLDDIRFICGQHYKRPAPNILEEWSLPLKHRRFEDNSMSSEIHYFWNTKIGGALKIDPEYQEEHFSLDFLESCVIEFTPSLVFENKIIRGRIWVETRYFQNKQSYNKPKELIILYNKMERWIKRKYKHRSTFNYYVGPHAYLWIKQGGKLYGNWDKPDALSL